MRPVLLAALTAISTDAFAQSVMVTEFMSNTLGNELTDEWIEIFNGTNASVNLNNWVLADEVADTVTLPSINVPSGGYVILTKDGPGFITQWGVGTLNTNVFTVNYGALSNGTDEIVLRNPAGAEVFHLAYDNDEDEGFATFLTPAIAGQTTWGTAAAPGVNRNGNDLSTFGLLGYESGDRSSDGFAFTAASGDVGSPLAGHYRLTALPASPSNVVISEVMFQSLNVGVNYAGDWFELYNPTGAAISLNGWHVRDGFAPADLWAFPNVSIPAGGKIVVTANPATFVATWHVGTVGTTVIGNGSVPSLGAEDELELLDASGNMVWSVAWDAPGVLGNGYGVFFTGSTYTARDWGQIGRRRVRLDGPDDVAGAAVGYQSGAFTADPAATTGALDRASPLAVAAGPVPIGPQLITTGACPGNETFTVSNLTHGGPWALVASSGTGTFTIPSGSCAGRTVPLSSAGIRLVGSWTADAQGNASRVLPIPLAACTFYATVIDLTTCQNTGPHGL